MADEIGIVSWARVAFSIVGRLSMVAALGMLTGCRQPSARVSPEFRVVTFNVLGCRGFPLAAGKAVAFDRVSPQIIGAVAHRILAWRADVVVLQEAPPENEVREIARLAGMEFAYFPAQSKPGSDWPFGFPGAVLTRHTIVNSQDCATRVRSENDARFQRFWGDASILMAGNPLQLSATHLCADWGGVNRESTRMAEISELIHNPDVDLIAADCNMLPGQAPWKALREAGWRDGWLEGKGEGAGFSSDARNPRYRIDYLWLSPSSRWRVRSAQVLDESFEIEVSGTKILLSDHYPVMMTLSLAPP